MSRLHLQVFFSWGRGHWLRCTCRRPALCLSVTYLVLGMQALACPTSCSAHDDISCTPLTFQQALQNEAVALIFAIWFSLITWLWKRERNSTFCASGFLPVHSEILLAFNQSVTCQFLSLFSSLYFFKQADLIYLDSSCVWSRVRNETNHSGK